MGKKIDHPLHRREFVGRVSLAALALAPRPKLLIPLANTMPKNPRSTGFVSAPDYQQHLTGPGHPESPRRHEAILRAVRESGLEPDLVQIEPRPATKEELASCHDRAYIELVRREVQAGAQLLSTGDTAISAGSFDVALLAAGAVLSAVDSVMEGKVSRAFCAIRPPGHHSNADRGMGFCLFNNIAVGARYAQAKYKARKILIADWDVHHGNGTQDIFYEDESVFFFDTHQSPWYPGTGGADETGRGRGEGFTLNCPFPAGSGRDEIVGAFKEKLIPAAAAFKPDLVMVSAGFDSRKGDPLGQFQLTDDDFAELTAVLLQIAREHAQGRIVSVLEGGYDLTGLSLAVTSHLRALNGEH